MAGMISSAEREKARGNHLRAAQSILHRRNRAIGLLLVAVLVLLWRLFHSGAGWLFPPGWWRP
jgi:hypothetical protein